MEIILDETSLVPCVDVSVADRILQFAHVLKAFDDLGAPRFLRSVKDAAHRPIEAGFGLNNWCFNPTVDQVAGRLIASRLSKQPYVDGPGGLFSQSEGKRAIEASVDGSVALGAGLAALNNSSLVALKTRAAFELEFVAVSLSFLSEEGESNQIATISRFVASSQIVAQRDRITELLYGFVRTGSELLTRQLELFPRLRMGPLAIGQLAELTGHEIIFRQLLNHLRSLNDAAANESKFEPVGIRSSPESGQTLNHAKFGPQRDFPVPDGFQRIRWSNHSKFGTGHRLYFCAEKISHGYLVLIGYFGPHLATVRN
jgi:phage FluMu protein gp41